MRSSSAHARVRDVAPGTIASDVMSYPVSAAANVVCRVEGERRYVTPGEALARELVPKGKGGPLTPASA